MLDKGFAHLILLVIGFLIITTGVIGGTYLLKNKFPSLSIPNIKIPARLDSTPEPISSKSAELKLNDCSPDKYFIVKGVAMKPNYNTGDVWALEPIKLGSIQRGDVVKFNSPSSSLGFFIKRIIGLPKDRIKIIAGRVLVNDKPITEDYLAKGTLTYTGDFIKNGESKVIPENEYFMLGDDRPSSSDSRDWGYVSGSDILAKLTIKSDNAACKEKIAQEASKSAQPTSLANLTKDDYKISSDLDQIKDALFCHIRLKQEFPSVLAKLDPTCITKIENKSFTNPLTKQTYNYTQTKEGKGFNIAVKLSNEITYVLTESEIIANGVSTKYNTDDAIASNDAQRLTDLSNLALAVNVAIQESSKSGSNVLCNGASYPCSGSSVPWTIPNSKNDGTGWVKINLSSKKILSIPVLPVDPINDVGASGSHYFYCADKPVGQVDGWEIDTVLTSTKYADQMKNDGGDDPNKYETGSNLYLINISSGCKY